MHTDERPPPIATHRLLSDRHGAALLRPDATVDWWCGPAFDDPPLLWALLDPTGAAARWCGARVASVGRRLAGPVLYTQVRVGTTRVHCLDGLVRRPHEGPRLVRLVRPVDADVELVHELSLGGFDTPRVRWDATGAARTAGSDVRVTGGRSEAAGAVLRSVVRARAGRWSGVMVAVDARATPEPADLLDELLDAGRACEAWQSQAKLPKALRSRTADALAVLDACTYVPSAAVVAAPTTSLPEAVGGDRQFDYRYTWVRDSALAVSVAALLGLRELAERYLAFVVDLHDRGRLLDHPVTDVRGKPVPDEREVAGVAGWAGSSPVRVGNAAGTQVQYDALGMLVESVSVFLQAGGALGDDVWAVVCDIADRLADPVAEKTSGIWELRDARRLVSGDIGRWVGLDRAVWIARLWRPTTRRRHWLRARARAREQVIGALTPAGFLPQAYDDETATPDAAGLMAVTFRLLDGSDPRAARLAEATIAALGEGPASRRYPAGADDGFSGVEATFTPVSWWAVAALVLAGRLDEAESRAAALDAALPRLLSEQFDVGRGESLGNAPLVWAHMEAARVAYLLDAARRRRRWGQVGLTAWRLARYARTRWGS